LIDALASSICDGVGKSVSTAVLASIVNAFAIAIFAAASSNAFLWFSETSEEGRLAEGGAWRLISTKLDTISAGRCFNAGVLRWVSLPLG
jgi:hypothetical protein